MCVNFMPYESLMLVKW